MSGHPFHDVLLDFKCRETREALLFIAHDREIRRTLAAWVMTPVKRPGDWDLVPNTWDGVWKDVTFDVELLANHLNTYEAHARQCFERVRGLRLIYPDGQLHSEAYRIMEKLLKFDLPRDEKEGEGETG